MNSFTLFFYQKDILFLSSTTIAFLSGIFMMPYCIKPVFGLFLDRLMIWILRAKYFFIVVQFLYIIICCIYSFVELTTIQFVLLNVLFETIMANENIMIESLLVKSTKKANLADKGKKKHNHLILYFGFRLFGTIMGLLFSG